MLFITPPNQLRKKTGVLILRVGNQVIRLIQKETEHLLAYINDSDQLDKEEYDCIREGLVRFSIGMSTHVSEDIVSATMAHLFPCQHGSRFTFLTNFMM